MKFIFSLILLSTFFFSCTEKVSTRDKIPSLHSKERLANKIEEDSLLTKGKTYLSIYSQVYSLSEHRKHNLTVTVSMRNTSLTDTLYLKKADHYSTEGKLIKPYLENTIYIAPMETLEIVINEEEISSGTGGNFMFDWMLNKDATEPLFESVMISTTSQQGLSFTSQGKRIQ